MCGYTVCRLFAAQATNRMASVSLSPIQTTPLIDFSSALNSDSVFPTNATISCARLLRNMPSSVSVILNFTGKNSVLPSYSSRSIICRERVGWVTCTASAAPEMFSSRATARK